ncbi:hypothetical protein FACS18947_1080 [Bacteroidia bacterium]|nr:hypothetical protein FACS18947_1080 [Bacteroidia bacterium]
MDCIALPLRLGCLVFLLGTNSSRPIYSYEEHTREKLYLGGDYYSAPAIYVREDGGSWNIYYICRDLLGSITHITNSAGTVVQELSYDAWGRLRNPVNQVAYAPGGEPELFIGRGYTGHEHLPELGLINMNARLYDPALGRFLSPDPYVQMPDFSQNFNRYGYALNNPLKYTDPDGEWIHIVIGAVVGGVINLGIKAYQGKINSWGDGFAAFGIGAAAGAIGAATGGAAFAAAGGAAGGAGGFLAGAAGGAAGTAFSSPVLSMGNSAYFGDPMMTGQQYLLGIAGGALLGGSVNGITALANGRSFMTGNLPSSNAPITPTVSQPAQPAQNTGTQQAQGQTPQSQSNNLPANVDYPPNNGAIGTPETKYLYQGEMVDRFGETTTYSRYLSPEDTPIPSRSLPPNTNLKLHDVFQVVKPFSVQSSTIAPYYGLPGMGTQYVTPLPIQLLVDKGILIRVVIPIP